MSTQIQTPRSRSGVERAAALRSTHLYRPGDRLWDRVDVGTKRAAAESEPQLRTDVSVAGRAGPGDDGPSVSLVVPLYNEQDRVCESLGALVEFIEARPTGSELIFVDDGSRDDTRPRLRDRVGLPGHSRVKVVNRPHRGKGAAVRAGLALASGRYAGFCDVDLSTPLDEMERLINMAHLGPALVIGSRDVITTQLVVPESGGRELLGKCFNRLVRCTLTPGIADTQCGAKVAATPVWRQVLPHCYEDGFAWDVEAVAVARRLGFAIWEVGIRWSHDPRSGVRPLRDGMNMVQAVPRIWRSVRAVRSVAGDQKVMGSLVSGEGSAAGLPLDQTA